MDNCIIIGNKPASEAWSVFYIQENPCKDVLVGNETYLIHHLLFEYDLIVNFQTKEGEYIAQILQTPLVQGEALNSLVKNFCNKVLLHKLATEQNELFEKLIEENYHKGFTDGVRFIRKKLRLLLQIE